MSAIARFAFAAAVLAFCLQSAASANDAEQRLRRAIELQKQGNYQAAAEAYESVLEIAPGRSSRVLAAVGSVYLRLGRPALAAERLAEALEIEPDLAAARPPLTLAYLQSGEFEKCEAQAARLAAGAPENAKARHLLGVCRLRGGDLEAGAAALEEALRLSPDQPEAAYTLATTYASLGRIADAERIERQYLSDTETAESLLVRGAIHKARGEYEQGIEALEQALRRKPGLPMAHELLGRCLVGLSRLPEAEAAYSRELSADPKNFNANAVLGWIRLRDKRYEEAAPFVEEALRQQPEAPGVLFMQAQIDDANGRFEEAAKKLEAVVEDQPENRAAHVLLARAYAKLKKREEFRREKEIIRRLTEKEQERNLLREEGYRGTMPLPPGEP